MYREKIMTICRRTKIIFPWLLLLSFILVVTLNGNQTTSETPSQREARMQWWKEARFGMFIHWGLYAIPAGEWEGRTDYGEWIRTSAQIPLEVYDQFVPRFNPVRFDAEQWVRFAKEAGMKYIVITSKHHDGFCLFDSKYTDFDIMSTPFKRDILKELSLACRKYGIKLCFYYSIMDWHHPDYLPRREWETHRTVQGAVFERYVTSMKNQLKELLTNYGPIGVLWFDGEWEGTWNNKYGKEIYDFARQLQPSIIVNNRVTTGRQDLKGFAVEGEFAGDFGTPEQQIPATGIPGMDWETCMTMNDHWGYNKNNDNWKTPQTLIRNLVDIVSKGGNYLLNVGPTSQGLFPQPSIDSLNAIGQWMKVNGEAIYATHSSPFRFLQWGRCTRKEIDSGVRLYLHVFQWPNDRKIVIPNIFNQPRNSYLLSDPNKKPLPITRNEDGIIIELPFQAPDPYVAVVVLDVNGKLDISNPPVFSSMYKIFIDSLLVSIKSDRESQEIRYTLDGSIPRKDSLLYTGPISLNTTTLITARCFRDGKPVSETVHEQYKKVIPLSPVSLVNPSNGINYKYYEGDWDVLPDFSKLTPIKSGELETLDITTANSPDKFAFRFTGYIEVSSDDVYTFSTNSDDGSRLYIDDTLVVDNDQLHGPMEREGVIALSSGFHPICIEYFEKTGGELLEAYIKGSRSEKQVLKIYK